MIQMKYGGFSFMKICQLLTCHWESVQFFFIQMSCEFFVLENVFENVFECCKNVAHLEWPRGASAT